MRIVYLVARYMRIYSLPSGGGVSPTYLEEYPRLSVLPRHPPCSALEIALLRSNIRPTIWHLTLLSNSAKLSHELL